MGGKAVGAAGACMDLHTASGRPQWQTCLRTLRLLATIALTGAGTNSGICPMLDLQLSRASGACLSKGMQAAVCKGPPWKAKAPWKGVEHGPHSGSHAREAACAPTQACHSSYTACSTAADGGLPLHGPADAQSSLHGTQAQYGGRDRAHAGWATGIDGLMWR